MSIKYELGISSSNAIQLYPDWNYSDHKKQNRTEHRTRSGKLFLYKWNDFKKFDFKIDWVAAANATVINSWWDSNAELLFFVTSDTATEVHSVMLLNQDTPLKQRNKPYVDQYMGTIKLEEY